ncbi:MAG: hypothetical protein ACM335_10245, partial [Deltaproteobacteria bacterium]
RGARGDFPPGTSFECRTKYVTEFMNQRTKRPRTAPRHDRIASLSGAAATPKTSLDEDYGSLREKVMG